VESEDPLDVLRETLGRFDLRGKKITLDDHAWAQTLLAFRGPLPNAEFVPARASSRRGGCSRARPSWA
jgi:hypothetical protein